MIKEFVPQEICLACLGCCRFSEENSGWQPRLLAEEKEKLAGKVKLLPHPKEAGFICACLDEGDNRCRIYDLRPFECQLYPFLLNRKGSQIFLAIDLNCPFAQGKLNTLHFREYLKYLTDLLESLEYLEILRNNPQVIQHYDEAFDLVELCDLKD